MRNALTAGIAWLALLPLAGAGQEVAEPFKVGTFEIDGKPEVGIVLRDSLILELDGANAALERDATYPALPMPADMIELIERYEYGLRRRLYEIVNMHVEGGLLGAAAMNPPVFAAIIGIEYLDRATKTKAAKPCHP